MKTKLTPKQIEAAEAMLKARPPVYDGTRVVIGDWKRNNWYEQVISVMKKHKVTPELTQEFCDIAGVPD